MPQRNEGCGTSYNSRYLARPEQEFIFFLFLNTEMQKAIEILEFLRFSSKLKSQERSIKISWERQESVADHSWHLCLMALLVVPHLQNKVDLLKTLKMALVHDIVEAEIGDTPHGLTATNQKLKIEKEKSEKKEIEKIRKMIGGDLGKEFYELWHEFEKLKTNEAKLVKALDSLEANHQSILFDVSYWDDYFYDIALTKADKFCKHEGILTNLNAEITNQMKNEFQKIGLKLKKRKKEKI
jgi:putative hydrolase of HD superfamily